MCYMEGGLLKHLLFMIQTPKAHVMTLRGTCYDLTKHMAGREDADDRAAAVRVHGWPHRPWSGPGHRRVPAGVRAAERPAARRDRGPVAQQPECTAHGGVLCVEGRAAH